MLDYHYGILRKAHLTGLSRQGIPFIIQKKSQKLSASTLMNICGNVAQRPALKRQWK